MRLFPPVSEYLDETIFQRANDDLVNILQREQPEKLQEILEGNDESIDPSFIGFVGYYQALSTMIPLHFTILDFGCCFAPQAWYFRRHVRYIGVDSWVPLAHRFSFLNTEHNFTTIQDWIEQNQEKLPAPAFAICQYVPDPDATKRVRANFDNVFCFYPQAKEEP